MFNSVKRFFYFHKRERYGIGVLVFLIFTLLFVQYLLPKFVKPKVNYNALGEFLKLQEHLEDSAQRLIAYPTNDMLSEKDNQEFKEYFIPTNYFKPFYFNPNTVSEEELVKMGFNSRFVKSFINFRNKGKIFKNEEDFKSVYGLTNQEFEKAKSFLTFPTNNDPLEKVKENEIQKRKELVMVDVNSADTTMLMKLRGIGPSFARRIVIYRNRLGGFYAKEQLFEVWGIDSALFNHIEPFVIIGPNIRQMDVNKVSLEQLKDHPYLNYSIANNIIQIRNRIGGFSKIDDIKKSILLKPEVFEKIKPYLTIASE